MTPRRRGRLTVMRKRFEQLTFPCWALTTSSGSGPLLVPVQDRTRALVLFTDEAALANYRCEDNLAGERIPFNNGAQLLELLAKLAAGSGIALNPEGFSAFRVTIEELRERLGPSGSSGTGTA